MANDQALKGVSDLISKLDNLGRLDDGKALRSSVRAGMRPALIAARVRSPVSKKPHKVYTGVTVQPGYSRSTLRIVTTVSADRFQATALLGTRKPAFYTTKFIELGTRFIEAYEWLRPAFYQTQSLQKEALAAKLRAYVDKVVASSGKGNVSSDS